MHRDLVFLAGKNALSIIRQEGLRSERVKVVAGAAGGPKSLVLSCLDRAVFGSWFKDRKEPLFLLGSSIGAWRLAAASRSSPSEAMERFQEAYIHQRFTSKPTRREVTIEAVRILNVLLGSKGMEEILEHPYLRLSIMAVRSKWPVAGDNSISLGLGLADAALYNVFHRKGLKFFFERTLFFDPREIPPFSAMAEFPVNRVPLSAKNLKHALLASSSIPLVMLGVKNIPGAPKGTYRDGGVIDYHFDLPFATNPDHLVLYPHYLDRIIPGWFDQKLPWRKPQNENLDNVVLVSPSREFVARLPLKRIAGRDDFRLFKGRDEERIAYWNAIVKASGSLGEEFLEATETGAVRELVEPLS
jgi:hypothetical protein